VIMTSDLVSVFRSPLLRLRNDLYCVEWGVKLYSLIPLEAHLSPCLYVHYVAPRKFAGNRKITGTGQSSVGVGTSRSMENAETTLVRHSAS